MNSLNDSFDKLLRKRFQQLFERAEATPDERLKKQIWAQVPHAHSPSYWVYGGLVLVLLTGVATYIRMNGAVDVSASTSQAHRYSPKQRLAHPGRLTNPVRVALAPVLKAQTVPRTALNPDSRALVPQAQPLVVQANGFTDRVAAPATDVLAEVVAKPVKQLRHQTTLSRTPVSLTKASQAISPSVQYAASGRSVLPTALSTEPRPMVETNPDVAPKALVNSAISAHTLPSLKWVSTPKLSAITTRSVSFLPPLASAIGHQLTHRTPVRWFVTVAPLSTYQRITVVAKTGQYVQHVGLPSAWSGQTWGYQLRGGVQWHQWDAFVSYGHLQRWASYDILTDDYQIDPLGPTDYRVTRLVETVADNVSLPILGLGLTKQYTLRSHPHWYGRIGGQLTYTPTSQQTQSWIQAGIGRTIALGSVFEGQVGPTVEYGLNHW